MVTYPPGEALRACEAALREVMAVAYLAEFGPSWLDRVCTLDQRAAWRQKAEREKRQRGARGLLQTTDGGLEFAEFTELMNIANRHWQPLKPALGEQKVMRVLLNEVERLRNAVAHSRPVYAHERELLSGLAGQIRNRVTIHMSNQDPTGDYYPTMTSACDSFGRAMVLHSNSSEIAGSVPRTLPVPRVKPGDVVTFTCSASDPQDRQLSWELKVNHGAHFEVQWSGSDEPVTLRWEVDSTHVRASLSAEIYVTAVGAEYHRVGTYDHRTYFMFAVDPPATAAME